MSAGANAFGGYKAAEMVAKGTISITIKNKEFLQYFGGKHRKIDEGGGQAHAVSGGWLAGYDSVALFSGDCSGRTDRRVDYCVWYFVEKDG